MCKTEKKSMIRSLLQRYYNNGLENKSKQACQHLNAKEIGISAN